MIKKIMQINNEDDLCFNEIKNINESLKNNPFFNCYKYEENNKILGYICFEDLIDRIEIDYIYVKPKYRNGKIGSKLIDYLIDYCIKKDKKNISLEVNEKNEIAIKLYKKYNFYEVAVRKNYYKNDNGILMIREVKQ